MFKLILVLFFSLSFALAEELDAQLIKGEQDFDYLPVSQQKLILKNLRRGYYAANLTPYYLAKTHEALAFLNPEMLKLLYAMNAKGSQSNCYWTSMFALGVLGLPERFMDLPEYDHLLTSHFELQSSKDQFLPGDVLRLKRARGNMETHSVVYLGTLKGDSYTHLVLTKNGPVDGHYLIMNLWDLQNRLYPNSIVAGVYRPLSY